MNRRGFLGAILAASMAPAIARSGVLMPIYVPKPEILRLWCDGIHDDTLGLQALINGQMVLDQNGMPWQKEGRTIRFPAGRFSVSGNGLTVSDGDSIEGGWAAFTGAALKPKGAIFNFQRSRL